MLNEQINEFANQASLTQVASYFDIVENAIKSGDTNKRYILSTNSNTAPSGKITNGSWTSVVISPTADNMCDLYNSYITAEVNFKVNPSVAFKAVEDANSQAIGVKDPAVWIGFKDAMDAISQYQILANGQAIYTQSNAMEESYITGLAATDAVKKVDVFSKVRHSDVWKGKDTSLLGQVYDKHATNVNLKIRIKIDIRRFLPLAAVKYIPKFAGNLELRIKFSPDGLVCAPFGFDYYTENVTEAFTEKKAMITNKFVPINQTFATVTEIAVDANKKITYTAGFQTIGIKEFYVDGCFSHLANFGLQDDQYERLVQRYTNEALSFPIQTLTFQQMNGNFGNSPQVDFSLTSTPRFVDSIFVLFPKTSEYHTCFENPLFVDFTLKMGGFGVMPDVQYDSASPACYEMAANAFNVNNDLAGFNKEVMRSMINNINSEDGLKSKDVTNFVLAFPVSTDNTFQQGQTSATPITYQLKGTTNSDAPYNGLESATAIMGFLKDSVFAIQCRPIGPAICAIDEYDITTPAQ